MQEDPLRYRIHLTLMRKESFFGSGVIWFLREIERTGSMHSACKAMGMAYSKGWKILNRAEHEMGFPFVERKSGGSKGGGSSITEQGHRLMDAYFKMEAELNRYAEDLFFALFQDL